LNRIRQAVVSLPPGHQGGHLRESRLGEPHAATGEASRTGRQEGDRRGSGTAARRLRARIRGAGGSLRRLGR
jgi:hypothetical protein